MFVLPKVEYFATQLAGEGEAETEGLTLAEEEEELELDGDKELLAEAEAEADGENELEGLRDREAEALALAETLLDADADTDLLAEALADADPVTGAKETNNIHCCEEEAKLAVKVLPPAGVTSELVSPHTASPEAAVVLIVPLVIEEKVPPVARENEPTHVLSAIVVTVVPIEV